MSDQYKDAWYAVVAALDKVDPDFLMRGTSGMEAAVLAIERLAAASRPEHDPHVDEPPRDDLYNALAEIRALFPTPAPGGYGEGEFMEAMSDPLAVPAYVKTMLAAPQPVQEADRRAGEAERVLAGLRDDLVRLERVRDQMKDQWGVDRSMSFDAVWAEALELRRREDVASGAHAQPAIRGLQDVHDAVMADPSIAEPQSRVIATAPKRIWLDLGFDPEFDDSHFQELVDVTWSEDNASGYGIEYTRADLATQTQRQSLTAEEAWDIIEKESWDPESFGLNAQLFRTIRRTEAKHGIGDAS